MHAQYPAILKSLGRALIDHWLHDEPRIPRAHGRAISVRCRNVADEIRTGT
jgi:hypothetical protein